MNNLLVISVATDANNQGFQYFINSLKNNNIQYKILGLNTKWKGGIIEEGMGGGQKINLLKAELKTWDTVKLKSTLLLFSDSYDVINVSNETEIIEKYYSISNNQILFSAEKYCWPDISLQQYYPNTKSKYKFLNSGGFIGKAYDILNILSMDINDDDDDQLYFTKIFLFNNGNIKLDYYCEIFQTLNGRINDIYIYKNKIINKTHSTFPSFIHGNGNSKKNLYTIAKHYSL
jgi:procollagen-lysine,2-oxoglutarate 5-dioxygenase